MIICHAYRLVSGTITIDRKGDNDAAKRADGRNQGVIFKNCAPFTDCINNINNNQIDREKDIDVAVSMYN